MKLPVSEGILSFACIEWVLFYSFHLFRTPAGFVADIAFLLTLKRKFEPVISVQEYLIYHIRPLKGTMLLERC
jgi:hypothetical protein